MYNGPPYFDAHLHFFGDMPFANTLAENIGDNNSDRFFVHKYRDHGSMLGGIVMGNGPLEKQGQDLPENFRYMLGLDEPSLFPMDEVTYRDIERHLQKSFCAGVKLYPGYIPIYPNDNQYYRLYELLLSYDKVLAVHTGILSELNNKGKMKYSRPIHLDDVAVDFPYLKIVMCHFGNPFLEEATAVMEHNSNVFADLSGLIEGQFTTSSFLKLEYRYINVLKGWIQYIGDSKRFLFGTDWPAVDGTEYLKFIVSLLPTGWAENVLLNNACKVFGLQQIRNKKIAIPTDEQEANSN